MVLENMAHIPAILEEGVRSCFSMDGVDMGRKRLGQNKERRIISISLDRELVWAFDSTLGDYTRSGRLEKLIQDYLKGNQTKITQFARHAYSCLDCGRSWHQNRKEDIRFVYCIGKDGCNSSNIEYDGVWGEEE